MAQEQLLVNTSNLTSSAGVPATSKGEVSGNWSPDSGVNDLTYGSEGGAGDAESSVGNGAAVSVHMAAGHQCGEDASCDQVPAGQEQHLPQQPQQPQQHVVHVHVNPGETFRVKIGQEMQQIKGPATVRMVSSSGPPPMPVPLQVPPGHMIQQIMDDRGYLTHVILSPQPPPSMSHATGPTANGAVPISYYYDPSWQGQDVPQQHSMYGLAWQAGNQGMQPQYYPAFGSPAAQYTPPYHHHAIAAVPAPQAPPARTVTNGSISNGSSNAQQHHHQHEERGGRKRKQTQDRQQRRGHGGGIAGHMQNTPPRWRNGGAHRGDAAVTAPSEGYTVPVSMAAGAPQDGVAGEVDDEERRLQLEIAHAMMANSPVISVIVIEARHATLGITLPLPLHVPFQEPAITSEEVADSQQPPAPKPTAPQPDLSPPAVQQPEAQQPVAQQPEAQQPVAQQPVAQQPEVQQSEAPQSEAPQPVAQQAEAQQPEAQQSEAPQPVAQQPEAQQPEAQQPGSAQQPDAQHPGLAQQPDVQQPVVLLQPGASRPMQPAVPDPVSDVLYEVQICERQKDGHYRLFYTGDATEILFQDLKPATDYYVKVSASLYGVHGAETEPFLFTTSAAVPDPPQAPKMSTRTRSSILLKWQVTAENGSKLTGYSLEMDQGNGKFAEAFVGLQRQFKVSKLSPSTGYYFRLAAINGVGKSDFSEVVQYFTCGSLPETPDAPLLVRATSDSLSLAWTFPPAATAAAPAAQVTNGDEQVTFSLQMEDESTRHGFLAEYNGSDTRHTVEGLRRNSDYKFRLCTVNDEGPSKWSAVVVYRTLPDSPRAPGKPQTKGKVHSTSFRLTWDAPRDTGGSTVDKYVAQLNYGADFEEVYCDTACECLCTDLHPGFTYQARVACRTAAAGLQSPWSELAVITTPPVTPAACPPPRVHGKAKAHSAEIRWSPPDYDGGAKVTEYKVQLLPVQADGSSSIAREVYHGQSAPGNMACTIAGLLAGHQYLVQVRAINKAGEGPWSEPLCLTTGAAPPGQPAPPECQARSPTSVLVSWCEPATNGAAIIEYKLFCSPGLDLANASGESSRPGFSQVYAGHLLSYEVKGLSPATAYDFRVEAINSAGASEASGITGCVTPASVPGPVNGVKATVVNATSIHLQWQEAVANGSEVNSYEVDLGSKQFVCVNGSANDGKIACECVIDDLKPLTNYKLRVRAINAVGCGPFSITPIRVTTSPLRPAAPYLELVAVTSNSVKLKWTAASVVVPSARASKLPPASVTADTSGMTYTLLMHRDGKSPAVLYSGSIMTHKVNRLTENTEHKFQVYATNSAGDGEPSDILSVVTAKAQPPALKAPSVTDVTPSSAVVSWQTCQLRATPSDSILYVVQLAQGSNPSVQDYKEVGRFAELSHCLTKLEPATIYHVRVAPLRVCLDDDTTVTGAFSQPTHFLSAPPLQAADDTASVDRAKSAKKPTSVGLKWNAAVQGIASWFQEGNRFLFLVPVLFVAFCIAMAYLCDQFYLS